VSTGSLLVLLTVLYVVALLALEAKKITNDTPGDLITNVVRRAFKAQPWVFLWLAFSVGYLAGHLFAWE